MSDQAPVDEAPEADAIPGAPHPRMTESLYGQEQAEAEFLAASASGRLHHAWLITGPKGVGKATLAWRIAKFLLGGQNPARLQQSPTPDSPAQADSLGFPREADSSDPPTAPSSTGAAAQAERDLDSRIKALSEPGLYLIRRPWDDKMKRHKKFITVDEVRGLRGFFGLTAGNGGWRVVIVDSAEEMNPNAANAILKLLEEPPPRATLLLVSHQPAKLLPTIRSRCRVLKCPALSPENMSLALRQTEAEIPDSVDMLYALSEGSAGEAFRLQANGGMELYSKLVAMLGEAPGIQREKAVALADHCSGKDSEDRLGLATHLILLMLARMAKTGAMGALEPEAVKNERAVFQKLSPDASAARLWAETEQRLSEKTVEAMEVNLDPGLLILDMLLEIDSKAYTTARRP